MILSEQQLDLIRDHKPEIRKDESLLEAAIAIILRDGEHCTEFLMMQRAHHEDDPWSGQMAFPGGKVELNDTSKKATAIRETQEEVSIQLTEQNYIGQLDDFYGMKVNNKNNAHVSCFVFKIKPSVIAKGNHEVADLIWLPMSYLQNPKHAYEYYHPHDSSVQMPAVLINESKAQILWGLSLRMLTKLYKLVGNPLDVTDNSILLEE